MISILSNFLFPKPLPKRNTVCISMAGLVISWWKELEIIPKSSMWLTWKSEATVCLISGFFPFAGFFWIYIWLGHSLGLQKFSHNLSWSLTTHPLFRFTLEINIYSFHINLTITSQTSQYVFSETRLPGLDYEFCYYPYNFRQVITFLDSPFPQYHKDVSHRVFPNIK